MLDYRIGSSQSRKARNGFLFSERKVYVLPEDGHIFLDYSARNRDQDFARLKVIKALATEDEAVVIAPVSAAIKKMPPHRSYQSMNFNIELGQEIEIDELKKVDRARV